MPTYTSYYIEVLLRDGGKPIKSPPFEDKETAQRDLEAIRKAQMNGDWMDLEWLTVAGRDVLGASLATSSVGFSFA